MRRSEKTSDKKAPPAIYREIGAQVDFGSDMPVYRQIEAGMEKAIEGGELRPGEKLPPERVLMELVGVSRSTLRAALAGLIRRNYLSATQGRGNFVLGPRRQKNLRFLSLEKFRADHWLVSPLHYDWIAQAAKDNGVQIHHHYTPTLDDLFQTLSEPPHGYDGLIIFRTLPEWSAALSALPEEAWKRFPIPIMLIGRPIRRPHLNAITYDYFEATRQATHLLIEQGHKRIALISGKPTPGHSFQEFHDGYSAALNEAGLPHDEKRKLLIQGNIFFGGASPDGVSIQISEFLRTGDFSAAVVCLVTGPFEKAVQREAIVIPDDLSVVAVTEEHALTSGALRWTAMSEPSAMIVRRGVELLTEVCREDRENGIYEVIAPIEYPGGTTMIKLAGIA